MKKPDDVFDRDREWLALAGFAADSRPGATLGLVYGRRRQGKAFLLESLAEAAGGLNRAAAGKTGDMVTKSRVIDGIAVQCDEYPFAITYEGAARPGGNYSALLINGTQNIKAGRQLQTYMNRDRILSGVPGRLPATASR